ncbi:hypothetical protein JXA84_06750 [candidate division WOR-3 bacterium]|nr:hypothetical protein [candidate division WOR-3 bacterium]
MNISISCPSCSSPVPYNTGDKVCKCKACGTVIKIILTGGIFTYRKDIAPLAVEKAQNDLKEEYSLENIRIIDRDTIFVPIWMGWSKVSGWVSGKISRKTIPVQIKEAKGESKTVSRTEGGEILRRIIDFPGSIVDIDNSFFREYFPSADLSFIEKDLLLFDEDKMKKTGMIFFPEKDIDDAKNLFVKKMKEAALSNWEKDKFDFFSASAEVLDFNLSLIFLPVILIRFITDKRQGFYIIDCTNGKTVGKKTETLKSESFIKEKGFFVSLTVLTGFVTGILVSGGILFKSIGILAALVFVALLFRKNYGD